MRSDESGLQTSFQIPAKAPRMSNWSRPIQIRTRDSAELDRQLHSTGARQGRSPEAAARSRGRRHGALHGRSSKHAVMASTPLPRTTNQGPVRRGAIRLSPGIVDRGLPCSREEMEGGIGPAWRSFPAAAQSAAPPPSALPWVRRPSAARVGTVFVQFGISTVAKCLVPHCARSY